MFNKILRLIEIIVIYIHYKKNKVHFDASTIKMFRGIPFIKNQGEILLSQGVAINSRYSSNPIGFDGKCTFIVKNGAKLEIGTNSGISNSTIVCWEKIIIGSNTLIGGGTKIYDTDFHSVIASERNSKTDNNIATKPIFIGSNVFIGAGVIILKGVTIGDNCVIGAGSVITKCIPSNQLWAGNPAKFIKEIENEVTI